MKGHWQEYFRLGIVHFMAYPGGANDEASLRQTIEAIGLDPDFEVIEIAGIENPTLRAQVAAWLKASGMTVALAGQPRILADQLNLNHPDEQERKRAISVLKSQIDQVAEFEGVGFALMSGPDPGPVGRDAAIEHLVDSLRALCEHAGKELPVILEVFDREIDKKCLIGSTSDAVEVARRVRETHANFGLLLDLSHLPLQREDIREALVLAQDYLMHVHIGNCLMSDPTHPAYGDHHPRFGLEGSEVGAPEFTRFLEALFEIGYLAEGKRPIVSFEIKPLRGETSELTIVNAKRTLAQAWRNVRL